MPAAKKSESKATASKSEDAEVESKSAKSADEPVQDENGVLPVERSGLYSVPHDDLNPAYVIDTSK